MFELQDDHFNTISFGNRGHVSNVVKQQVHDGRYRNYWPWHAALLRANSRQGVPRPGSGAARAPHQSERAGPAIRAD